MFTWRKGKKNIPQKPTSPLAAPVAHVARATVAPAATTPIIDGPIDEYLRDLHFRVSRVVGGNVATYIPELAKANPNLCGIAIATVDGAVYSVGDAGHPFTIQSVSKPFVYGYALQEYGRDAVLQHVGVEPTGEAFNSIVLDDA
ncbi:MAG: glutaminase, partial [Caulobacterales bacterium]